MGSPCQMKRVRGGAPGHGASVPVAGDGKRNAAAAKVGETPRWKVQFQKTPTLLPG
ncbi:hypothetical protein D3C72_1935910 [compost metagenome]